MAFSTRFGLRRRAFLLLVGMVGAAALGVLGARGAALWLDGDAERAVAWLAAATGGDAAIGHWQVEVHGVNPVVHARGIRVAFDGVTALAIGRLDVEIDLLESLARGVPVAHGLVLEDASIALTADAAGVRLAGAPPRPADDTLLRMLLDSDAVVMRGVGLRLRHTPSAALCDVRVELDASGDGGRHRAALVAGNEAGTLRVDADVAGPAMSWRLWHGDARVAFDMGPAGLCRDVRLSGPLADASWSGGRATAELHFARGEVSSVLRLAAHGRALDTRIDLPALSLRGVWRAGRWRASAEVGALELDGAPLFGPPGRMDMQYHAGVWRAVMPPSQLAVLAQRLLAFDVLSEARSRWLKALAPAADMGPIYLRVDPAGWALSARFSDLAMQPYKGSPGVAGASGRVTFFPGGLEVHMEPARAGLSFPDVFSAPPPPYEQISGTLQMAFEPGWVAIVGRDLEARSEVGRITGDFALWRPRDQAEQVLFVDITLQDGTPRAIGHYIPKGLSDGLERWLRSTVVNDRGRIDGRLVYHGHLRRRPDFASRQMALGATVREMDFNYDPEWPHAHIGQGRLVVDHSGVTAQASRFALGEGAFRDGTARLPARSDVLRVHGRGRIDAGDVIELLRQTPIRDRIAFLDDGWRVSGPMATEFDGRIPLAGAEIQPVVRVDADLLGVEVHNPDLVLEVGDLRGAARYEYPSAFTAGRLAGVFLDRPTVLRVATDESIKIHFDSVADVGSVRRWTGPGLIDAASGEIGYRAVVDVPLDSRPVSIALDSDLVGVSVDLPQPVGKLAASSRPSHLRMWFPEDHLTLLRYDYGDDVRGISEIRDGRITRATVALTGAEPELPRDSHIVVTGSLHRASVEEWLGVTETPAGNDAAPLPPVHLDGLQIDYLHAFDRVFEDMHLDALDEGDAWRLGFSNAEFAGRAVVPDVGPSSVDLDYAHLQRQDSGGDGIAAMDFSTLDDVDLSVKDLEYGGEPFGSWRFQLRVTPDVLRLQRIVGEARGVQVGDAEHPASLIWSKAGGVQRTVFGGIVRAHDVAAAQAAWGFDPSLVAEDMSAHAALAWPGPPHAFAPNRLSGAMRVESGSGRFEQIQAGARALRVLGIFNFAALSRRARLDFSDVLGKGLSFDRIKAEMRFKDGVLELPVPALVTALPPQPAGARR